MIYGNKLKDKTIVEQMASIRRKYANFEVKFDKTSLTARGEIRPTARSERYTIEIYYKFQDFPNIYVLKPKLIKNFKGQELQHVYTGKKLCLFQPKYREFKFSDYISETIIPWTSLWLYHYEDWHITGEWHGGGEHP